MEAMTTSAAPRVLAFPGYRAPAGRLAARLGWGLDEVAVRQFPDGESLVRLPASLPEHAVFYLSFDRPNERLVELELAAATARDLGAGRLTLVAPYLCYMRQDSAFHPGEAVSQRVVGRLLARRFDEVVTVDPHLHRTARLEDAVPARRAVAVTAAPALAEWLAARDDAPVLLGPDAESAQWVRAVAEPGGLEHAVAHKVRHGDRDVTIRLPDFDFAGRDVVLVDDVASTGHTLAGAARAVLGAGAARVDALVTHALFVGDALDLLAGAGVGEVRSTDSLPHPTNAVHLDALLAGALEGA